MTPMPAPLSAPDLFGYRKYWAKRLTPAPVLPMTRDEMDTLGWDECDVIIVTGDAYVCAFGSYAADLLRPVGIRLPIYPVKGYSVTLPVTNDAMAPQSTIMDETYKVAITRLGDRIRVAGTAEIAGYSNRLGPHATETVRYVVGDLFPRGGDLSRAEGWTGLRPMTPDGTPVLGPTRVTSQMTHGISAK